MKASIFLVLFLMSGLISCGFSKPQNPNLKDAELNPFTIFGRWNLKSADSGSGEVLDQENHLVDAETIVVEENGDETGVDLTGKLEELFDAVDKYFSEKGKEVSSQISSEMSQLGQNLGAQISSLRSNESLEMNSLREELKKEIFLLKDEVKTQFLNSNASAPPTPTLTAPRFYVNKEYEDVWFSPAPGWEKECTEMPAYMNSKASSVKLGGHCLLVCATSYCENSMYSFMKKCTEFHPDSFGLDNLEQIGYNDEISSFRLCHKK